MSGATYVDRFDTTLDILGRKRTYAAVKARVLEVGRFSCFEASATDASARMFDSLVRDPEVETFDMGYPWTGVRRKATR
jgi:hypothetical protein